MPQRGARVSDRDGAGSRGAPTARPARERASMNGHAPTAEQIAARAYELFLGRGGEHGKHEQDWLEAERELQNGSSVQKGDPASGLG